MIHRIYSDLQTFKNIELNPGLNVLLADREGLSTNLQTRNRAGKSSLIQLIHFVLGATAGPSSIFRHDTLKSSTFGLIFDLGGQKVSAERNGSQHGRVVIRDTDTSDWAFQPISRSGVFNSLSLDDWRSLLGEKIFKLPAVLQRDREKYSPTFRSLLSYFVRRESDGGFRHPQSQSTMQQTYDQQVAISYLLGLDWKISQSWEIVRQREKTLIELRRAASAGAFGGIISTSGQLRTELAIAETATERLQTAFNRFEVLPEYRELEQEASRITLEINMLSNDNTIDEQYIDSIQSTLESERPPESSDLFRLYQEAQVTLPEIVRQRFEAVQSFHDSVISNRKDYLSTELEASNDRLNERITTMRNLDARLSEIMRTLQSRGALDQFQALQRESSRQEAATEAIRQRYQAAEQLEGTKTQLDIERGRLVQQLRRDLDEQRNCVTEAITTFESISHSLYEEAGSLTLEPTDNGLRIEVRIQGELSRGIQNMQIFCFDLMLMKLSSNSGLGPGFLVHDSHLFDGVDERQVARAIQLGAETASACDWQYFVTLNSDDVPREFDRGFDFNQHVLPVRLTDATENGGLFGFRF